MTTIGDVCPLFFDPLKDPFRDADYCQKFHASDVIVVQAFSDETAQPPFQLRNLNKGTLSTVVPSSYDMGGGKTMYYCSLTGLDDGFYSLSVGGKESEPFCVSSSDILLSQTSLIRYSHKDNNSVFNNLFWIGDEQVRFSLRLEAGFLPRGYSSAVSNEQYRNQFQEITELYSVPYDKYTLAVGNAAGVPVCYEGLLNRILCLSEVEIGGRLYVRSESSVFEKEQPLEDTSLFRMTIQLEPRENPISGIGGKPEEAAPTGVAGFFIDNPKDGEMLQYDSSKGAFKNVTTVEV